MLLNKSYYKTNFKLALPIMLSSIGQSIVQMIDTIMVGQLGAKELAAVAFAGSVSFNALVVGMGIAMALTPLTGQGYVKGEHKKIGLYFLNALSLNTIIGIILTVIMLSIIPLLQYFGQPQEIIDICKPYYFIITIGFIPHLIFLGFKQFLEGVGNTKISMIITISANILNIILNYLLIYGKFGFPHLGVTGAAIATFISKLMMPIAFFIYIYAHQKYKRYFSFFSFKEISSQIQLRILRIGLPIAGQMFLEFSSLLAITIMMGWIGTEALAGYQIVMSIVSTTFLIASGCANATTILVSHEFGRKNKIEIKKHAKAGFHLAVLTMIISSTTFICFGQFIAEIFSQDNKVVEYAVQLFIVAGFFQVFDGSQVSYLGALRGINDVSKPMLYALISYSLFAIPFAYIFGFILNLGACGVFSGFIVGLVFAAILYSRRFYSSVKKIHQ